MNIINRIKVYCKKPEKMNVDALQVNHTDQSLDLTQLRDDCTMHVVVLGRTYYGSSMFDAATDPDIYHPWLKFLTSVVMKDRDWPASLNIIEARLVSSVVIKSSTGSIPIDVTEDMLKCAFKYGFKRTSIPYIAQLEVPTFDKPPTHADEMCSIVF